MKRFALAASHPPHALLSSLSNLFQGVLDFKGGESAALARLNYYLFESNLIATYFDTRNGMLGGWRARGWRLGAGESGGCKEPCGLVRGQLHSIHLAVV